MRIVRNYKTRRTASYRLMHLSLPPICVLPVSIFSSPFHPILDTRLRMPSTKKTNFFPQPKEIIKSKENQQRRKRHRKYLKMQRSHHTPYVLSSVCALYLCEEFSKFGGIFFLSAVKKMKRKGWEGGGESGDGGRRRGLALKNRIRQRQINICY